eukprot:6333745-Pyramimonas_sp.AAC.1
MIPLFRIASPASVLHLPPGLLACRRSQLDPRMEKFGTVAIAGHVTHKTPEPKATTYRNQPTKKHGCETLDSPRTTRNDGVTPKQHERTEPIRTRRMQRKEENEDEEEDEHKLKRTRTTILTTLMRGPCGTRNEEEDFGNK